MSLFTKLYSALVGHKDTSTKKRRIFVKSNPVPAIDRLAASATSSFRALDREKRWAFVDAITHKAHN